jgi:hypothetical protein
MAYLPSDPEPLAAIDDGQHVAAIAGGLGLQVRVNAVEFVVATLRHSGGTIFFEFENAAEPGSHFANC